MSSLEQKPNGCNEEHWKECEEKEDLIKGVYCKNPKNTYDKIAYDNGMLVPICPFHKNAIEIDRHSSKTDIWRKKWKKF